MCFGHIARGRKPICVIRCGKRYSATYLPTCNACARVQQAVDLAVGLELSEAADGNTQSGRSRQHVALCFSAAERHLQKTPEKRGVRGHIDHSLLKTSQSLKRTNEQSS